MPPATPPTRINSTKPKRRHLDAVEVRTRRSWARSASRGRAGAARDRGSRTAVAVLQRRCTPAHSLTCLSTAVVRKAGDIALAVAVHLRILRRRVEPSRGKGVCSPVEPVADDLDCSADSSPDRPSARASSTPLESPAELSLDSILAADTSARCLVASAPRRSDRRPAPTVSGGLRRDLAYPRTSQIIPSASSSAQPKPVGVDERGRRTQLPFSRHVCRCGRARGRVNRSPRPRTESLLIAFHGGGGNRTRVRGRTGMSIYKLRSPFAFIRRPVCDRPTAGLALLRCRASGEWLSFGAEPAR